MINANGPPSTFWQTMLTNSMTRHVVRQHALPFSHALPAITDLALPSQQAAYVHHDIQATPMHHRLVSIWLLSGYNQSRWHLLRIRNLNGTQFKLLLLNRSAAYVWLGRKSSISITIKSSIEIQTLRVQDCAGQKTLCMNSPASSASCNC